MQEAKAKEWNALNRKPIYFKYLGELLLNTFTKISLSKNVNIVSIICTKQ